MRRCINVRKKIETCQEQDKYHWVVGFCLGFRSEGRKEKYLYIKRVMSSVICWRFLFSPGTEKNIKCYTYKYEVRYKLNRKFCFTRRKFEKKTFYAFDVEMIATWSTVRTMLLGTLTNHILPINVEVRSRFNCGHRSKFMFDVDVLQQ